MFKGTKNPVTGVISNLQQVVDNSGNVIQKVTITTPPATNAETEHTFTNIPGLTNANDIYVLQFSSECIAKKDLPIPNFISGKVIPTISNTTPCYNEESTIFVVVQNKMLKKRINLR